jgi:hypothetical protein
MLKETDVNYFVNFMGRKKNMKNIRIGGAAAEIQTGNLPNTNPNHYRIIPFSRLVLRLENPGSAVCVGLE